MTTKLLIIAALILAATVAGAKSTSSPPVNGAASPPPPKPDAAPGNCSDELVEFSKCLPYISSAPNNTTGSPSRQCCQDVASAYISGSAVCFCYLVHKPGLLGFPLNTTRILSLSSLCPIRDHGTKANFSLKSLCFRKEISASNQIFTH